MFRAAPGFVAFALSLLALSACGTGSQDPREALVEEIAINRAVWEAQRPDHYTFVLRRQCFCGPEAVGPVALEVDGTVVVSRVYMDDGSPVPQELESSFPTISGLFDILDDAVESGADDIDVTWDPVSGVPRSFFIDYQVNVADEEQGYDVVDGPDAVPEEEGEGDPEG